MSDFAYMDMPLQIGFQYAGPLDKYAQFATRAEADAWLNGALSYEGALVRVKETLTDNEWHLYTVNIVNGTKTFVATGINDLELDYTVATPEADVFVKTDETGYVNNGILNTTVETAVAGKLVLTDETGLVNNGILDTTVKAAVAGKLVLTDETGMVNDAVLNTTVAGGVENAGKMIKVNAEGLIDSTLIPSIAIGEDLGRFESWEAAEAGVAHLPEHGDTIAIGTAEENDIFICLSPNAETFAAKFTTLKPSSGVVTVSDFNAHRNNQNTEKHVTQEMIDDWNSKPHFGDIPDISHKLEVGDILSDVGLTVTNDVEGRKVTVDLKAATTTDLGGVIVGKTLNIAAQDVVVDGVVTVKAGTINANVATKDTLGVVQVGGGLNVTDGVISVDETNLKSHFDQRYYILKDGEAQEGYQLLSDELIEKINEVNEWYDGGKEIQDASATQKGVVQIGDNIDVTDGLISVATGSKDVKGVLKVGENIDVADGVISVKKTSKTNLGLMQVGSGLDVDENGVVSANILWTETTLELNAGATEDANKYQEFDKVCEVKIFDENGGIVFPSEYIVKGGKTRIEFPADFPADGEDVAKWTVLVGPAIQ